MFLTLDTLPKATQDEYNRITAIAADVRNASETAFLAALADYAGNSIISEDADGNIMVATGTTVPSGQAGFAKSASFIKTDATTGVKALYENVGTTASCVFNLIGEVSEAEIGALAVATGKLANLAVTAGKLAADAVETAKIKDANVTAPKLAASLDLTGHALTNLSVEVGTPVNAVASRGTLTVTGGGTQITDGYKVTIDEKMYTFKTALTPTEGEVLIGVSDTTALANLLAAINHTGTPDTDYKCAAVHPTVTGISSNATTLIVEAKVKGVSGDAIASTVTDAAELSWNGTTLGTTVAGVNGTVGTAKKILSDGSYLYLAIAANTIADANWRRIDLGSAF